MESHTIALFGEAEKGDYCTGYLCYSLAELVDNFGNPPIESQGLPLAVQGLLFHRHVLFFRVEEEGYSEQDYLLGLTLLAQQKKVPQIDAIGIPGVGSNRIIEAAAPICQLYHSILLITEADLFDYMTQAA